MKTEELIRALAHDAAAEPPLGRALGLGLSAAMLAAVAGLLAVLGPRPDLAQAIFNPVSAMRFVLTLGLGILGLRAVMALARPEAAPSVALPVLLVPAMAIGLWLWAWSATPVDGRQMAIVGKTMVSCLVTIPVLSLVPVAVIMATLRRGAPTRPAWAGAMAGVTGGGLAAAVYAIHCTEDSPLFYVTWYGLAIVLVTLVSILVGKFFLRW